MISFVSLHVTFNFTFPRKVALINDYIWILSDAQFIRSCISLFLLGLLVQGVCLIE